MKSFLNPPIEGEIPGKLCATFAISLFPPGYVSISTAENDWVDNGVSLDVLKELFERIISSKASEASLSLNKRDGVPTDFTITL